MKKVKTFNKRFQEEILKTIKRHNLIECGERVVVGVSGGHDSVCLLDVLHSLSGELDIRLYAVHINHLLRAEEAGEDEKYTVSLCENMNIPLTVGHFDVAAMARTGGLSLEEAGREARYSEYEKVAASVGATKIAVAHNRNDQAETIMLNIIRGTGAEGLTGMEYMRGSVIRPLLGVQRDDIERYCREAGLEPRTDSTNTESEFTRNKIRLELFPFIDKNFGIDMTESLCRLAANISPENDYMKKCSLEAYDKSLVKKSEGYVKMKLEWLQRLHPSILARVLKKAVSDAAGDSMNIGRRHYKALSGLVSKGRTGTGCDLPGRFRALVSYESFTISSGTGIKTLSPFKVPLRVPGSTYIVELESFVEASLVMKEATVDMYKGMGYNSLVQFFDYDSLGMGMNIRNRRDGDIFRPLKNDDTIPISPGIVNTTTSISGPAGPEAADPEQASPGKASPKPDGPRPGGTKKLKSFFIDSKIPRELRDEIPLVCSGEEIVWIVGYRISDKFKVTENTKSVLKMEYRRRT